MTSKNAKLVALISKYPGLDAISLKGKGWRPQTHGSLREAQSAGLIEFRNGGWFVSGRAQGKGPADVLGSASHGTSAVHAPR
jgi:hypothetical protein